MDVGTPWEAPLRAYLLTGLVAARRGADAQEAWKKQDKPAQADTLSALAAQVRHSARALAAARGKDGMILDVAESMQRELCSEAFKALVELLSPDPGPWQLPECGHCAENITTSLIHLAIRLAVAQGMDSGFFAELCLRTAGQDAAG
ncbi:MAG TPA: hypothetical protein VH307_31330 [Streptosporangiaceae bacterium]|nr:hypothetical protein [Streptosporangiaceae bacterium]